MVCLSKPYCRGGRKGAAESVFRCLRTWRKFNFRTEAAVRDLIERRNGASQNGRSRERAEFRPAEWQPCAKNSRWRARNSLNSQMHAVSRICREAISQCPVHECPHSHMDATIAGCRASGQFRRAQPLSAFSFIRHSKGKACCGLADLASDCRFVLRPIMKPPR